jgi:hypothetical protein
MMTQPRTMPDMPEIGRPEIYYAKRVREADKRGDQHAHEAYKVGQYITLALQPHLDWEEKLKYFRHALKRHCAPPPIPDDDIWLFYRNLGDLVRTYAGQEALRMASEADDRFAARLELGGDREAIEDEAALFFSKMIHEGQCPEWFHEGDWQQLRIIRDQWV